MPSLVIKNKYTDVEQKEIMSVFLTPQKQQIPKYIQSVSDELFVQISHAVQMSFFIFGGDDETGADYRERGKDIKTTAKTLKRLLHGSSKSMFNSIDVMLAQTMKMPRFSQLNDYHRNKGAFVIESFLEVLTLIELTGHDVEHRASVTKGKNYNLERDLVFNLALAWFRVTQKKPSITRGAHFHKLVVKVFELEGLGVVSSRTMNSAMKMYTQKV